jgi:hypothetical protein
MASSFLDSNSCSRRVLAKKLQPLDIWFGECAGTMDDMDAQRKQILHALAPTFVQSRQIFESTLREQ